MVELLTTYFQGNSIWAAVAGPVLYLVVVLPVLAFIVWLLVRNTDSQK